MDTRVPVYLKPNVQVEPLVDQWYAWSHLLTPQTAARNLTERHLKIMDSYIDAPEVHAAAVRNPRLLGGPFIDYGGGRVDEIRALRDRTIKERSSLIALSQALAELDTLVQSQATGYAMTDLYARVPPLLRGYVELVYDLNNHPSYRLIEPLIYRSAFHDPSGQSLMLSSIRGDDRPFALSTPRLPDPASHHWAVPFTDPAVDALFRLKTAPRPLGEFCEMLGARPDDPVLAAFVTKERPQAYQRYSGGAARWRYFGHACVLVETPKVNILFDPVLSYTYESEVARYTYQDLPDFIDYVIITHNHQDHLLFETLLQIRHQVGEVIVPRAGGSLQDPSMLLLLRHAGFTRVREISELDEIPFDGGTITSIPFFGEHSDLDIRTKSAYLVRFGHHSLLFAADSCNVEPALYRHLRRSIGPVDALFLGMECNGAPLTWLYGPLLTRPLERAMDQSRRLAGSNFDQAIDIVNTFDCREVYVYAMGQEPWLNYVMSLKYTEKSKPIIESNRLLAECRARGMVAERLFGEREMFLDDAVHLVAGAARADQL